MVSKQEFSKDLLRWFEVNGRSFPWRRDGLSLYEVLVTEILLWKTRAETIADFLPRFFAAFPDEHSLTSSSMKDLIAIIQNLGLQNRRAKMLRRIATGNFDDKIADEKLLRKTFGVGQYISRATLAIHYGVKVIPVDENIKRLLQRIFDFEIKNVRTISTDEDEFLSSLLVKDDCKKLIWAMIDYSSTTCKRDNPACDDCRFNEYCTYFFRRSHSD
jgi:A/G-specific adenine glycosylase